MVESVDACHHDRALEARGLFSIPAYLHAWNRHIDLCTRLIPAHRRLIPSRCATALARRDGVEGRMHPTY